MGNAIPRGPGKWVAAAIVLLAATRAGAGDSTGQAPRFQPGSGKLKIGERVVYYHAPKPKKSPAVFIWCHPATGNAEPGFQFYKRSNLFGSEILLLCPQAKGRHWRMGDDAHFVISVLQEAIRSYNINPEQVVLAGHSSGAIFTYDLGLKYRKAFAALVVAGGLLRTDPPKAEGSEVPAVYIYHSPKDQVFPYRKARKAKESLEAAGYGVKLVTHDRGHGIGPKLVELVRRTLNEVREPAGDADATTGATPKE